MLRVNPHFYPTWPWILHNFTRFFIPEGPALYHPDLCRKLLAHSHNLADPTVTHHFIGIPWLSMFVPGFFCWRVVLLRTVHVVVMTPCPSSGSTFLQLNPGASPANTSAKVLHGRRTPERMVLKLDDLLFLQNPNPQLIGPSVKKLGHGHDRSCLCALWVGHLGRHKLINPNNIEIARLHWKLRRNRDIYTCACVSHDSFQGMKKWCMMSAILSHWVDFILA